MGELVLVRHGQRPDWSVWDDSGLGETLVAVSTLGLEHGCPAVLSWNT